MDIKKSITFRHMTKSEVMEEHANMQLAKVEKFLEHERTPIFIELVLEASAVHAHPRIELHVKTPHYSEFVGHEFGGTPFYEALDTVIDTMYRKLRDHKKRLLDQKKSVGRIP